MIPVQPTTEIVPTTLAAETNCLLFILLCYQSRIKNSVSINEQLLTTDEVLSLADPRGSTLARDRCQPVGVDRPARPVSTAKRDIIEAVRDAAAEDGAQDGGEVPETCESSSLTTQSSSGAEEVEPHPTNRGVGGDGTSPSVDTPAEAGESADGESESSEDDGSDTDCEGEDRRQL
jgi:hypothetical protein